MGLFEDAAASIPRLVRIVFRGLQPDDYDEIAQRAVKKLAERLSPPFRWKVVYSTGIDYFRETGRYVPLPPGVPVPPAARPPSPPPLVVVEERLRLIYGSGVNRPHEAIVYGYHTHLGYKPEEIVSNLAAIPLERLTESLVKQYADAAGLATGQIGQGFAGILGIRGTPAGAATLQDHWKPADTVADWIQDVEAVVFAAAAAPAGAAVPNFGAAACKPPNRRIAWAYGSGTGLGHPPDGIVTRFGHLPLEQLETEFEAEYRSANPPPPIPVGAWKPVITVNGMPGERQLMSYYTPPRIVAHWVLTVKRRLKSAEHDQEKQGLALLFQFNQYAPEETQAFIYNYSGFLGVPATDVARDNRQQTLSQVGQDLVKAYARKWGFDVNDVARWFRPLEDELKATGKQNHLFGLYFPDAKSVSDAREKVLRAFRPQFQGGRHLPLFGWRHELL